MSNKRLMYLLFMTMGMTDTLPQWPDPWAWSWPVIAGRLFNIGVLCMAVYISDISEEL